MWKLTLVYGRVTLDFFFPPPPHSVTTWAQVFQKIKKPIVPLAPSLFSLENSHLKTTNFLGGGKKKTTTATHCKFRYKVTDRRRSRKLVVRSAPGALPKLPPSTSPPPTNLRAPQSAITVFSFHRGSIRTTRRRPKVVGGAQTRSVAS